MITFLGMFLHVFFHLSILQPLMYGAVSQGTQTSSIIGSPLQEKLIKK